MAAYKDYPTFKKKNDSLGLIFAGCLGAIALAIALDFLYAWVLMLVMGALNAVVHPSIPAPGFWGAFVIVIAINVVETLFRGVFGSKEKN